MNMHLLKDSLFKILKNLYFILGIIIILTIVLMNITSIKLTTVNITDSSGNTQKNTLPFNIPSNENIKEYTYSGIVHFNIFSQKWVRIIPDDGVTYIKVNGKDTFLNDINPVSLRDWMNGFNFNLGKYLTNGENQIEIKVFDNGGKTGLKVENTFRDIGYFMYLTIFLLASGIIFYTIILKIMNLKKIENVLALLLFMTLGFILRLFMFNEISGDFGNFLSPWLSQIRNNGGFLALKNSFSDYTPPYLYIMAFITYLPFQDIYSLKMISVIFDFICAALIAKIIQKKFNKEWLTVISFSILLFLPTVFLNGAYWAQCDSIFTAFLLASVLAMIEKKHFSAFVFYGIAFSLKLQAVFLLPLYIALLIKNEFHFKYLFIIPVCYIVFILPNALLGRPLTDLFMIYVHQTSTYNTQLTLYAPNLYQWFSNDQIFLYAGVTLSLSVVLLVFYLLFVNKVRVTKEIIIKLSLLFLLIIPFTLPSMHERYFFPADVFSIAYAFYFPAYFIVAILVQLGSFFSYGPFIFGKESIPMAYVPFFMLAAIIIVVFDLIKTIKGSNRVLKRIKF